MVGKFPSTGLQVSFFGCFRKNWPIWFLLRGDTLYQVDLVRQALWFMARKKGEVGVFAFAGRWLSKILKYRTGHCSLPVANIFGLKCRWCEPSNPWEVWLSLSDSQTKISALPVSGSICSSKSPQQSFQISSLALNREWSEKNQHNVRWSASGSWQQFFFFFTCQFTASVWLVSSPLFHKIFSFGGQYFSGTTKLFVFKDIERHL